MTEDEMKKKIQKGVEKALSNYIGSEATDVEKVTEAFQKYLKSLTDTKDIIPLIKIKDIKEGPNKTITVVLEGPENILLPAAAPYREG